MTGGRVLLVGGGPGDPMLLTRAAFSALQQADVVVCDRLAPLAVLDELDHEPEVIHVGKIPHGPFTPQDTINALLIERAHAGQTVVRLKGGDGFVFGRGGEEYLACAAAGVPVTVIPGITSAVAVPALADIPVTHRGLTQGFTVVSGHVPPGDPRSDVDWAALATSGLTLVILMGVANVGAISDALIAHGLAATTPAVAIEHGSTPRQRVVRADLARLPGTMRDASIDVPAVVVIGAVTAVLEGSA